jgi:sugar phosphate isomerase/epimerase
MQIRRSRHSMTRRRFIRLSGETAAAVSTSFLLAGLNCGDCEAAENPLPPVAVFSKIYQELKLDFRQSAEVTAAAGLDGIDCAVRPGGEIQPERAAEQMPQYAAALAERRVRMLLLTTAVQGVDSPHARDILTAAKALGIKYYRLGYWMHGPGVSADKSRERIRSSLKELAAMNREIGVCALFHNHSSGNDRSSVFAGGDLAEMYELVKDFDADQVGVAFDLGHAIITHGDQWRSHFERLEDHIRVVYLKDVKRPAQFVPFGQGEFGRASFFDLLAKTNYRAPLSMHVEYDWAPRGQKTRERLVETLKSNRRVVGQWFKGV